MQEVIVYLFVRSRKCLLNFQVISTHNKRTECHVCITCIYIGGKLMTKKGAIYTIYIYFMIYIYIQYILHLLLQNVGSRKKITVKEERGRNLFYILKGSSEKKIIKSNKIYLSITILLILIFVNNVFLCTSVTIV